jgi:two-component system cell cycle response regulator
LTDLESKIKGVEHGADDFLIKPINGREIRARVRALLKKKAYIAKLHAHYETAFNSAITAGLTGLYNHAYFMRFLELELKRSIRQGYPTALIMLDIDDFKKYNDALGHLAGDFILRELAQVIKKNIREIDLTARYGGEEFAAVLPYANREDALIVSERIREVVSSHIFFHETSSPVKNITASLGVALGPKDASTAEELIKKADFMLYQAKKEGKNRVYVFDKDRGL